MEDPCREMEMVSTCSESVLRDLELLQKNLKCDIFYVLNKENSAALTTLKMNLPSLRPVLWGARKLSNNDVCSDLESNGVNHLSFLSTIEENLMKYEEDIHSLSLRPQSEYILPIREIDIPSFMGRSENKHVSAWVPAVCGFQGKIASFVGGIRRVYSILYGCCSPRLLGDDELMEFVDYVLQNLAGLLRPLVLENDLLHPLFYRISTTVHVNKMALHAQIETLQEELTFSKHLICFAKLGGVERGLLEILLSNFQIAVLGAAIFAYNCSFHKHSGEVNLSILCSRIGDLLGMMPILSQKQIQALKVKASKSSALLHNTEMAKHIMGDFNDSLISRLWPLLWSSTSFMDCLKDQILILYKGLRFLRSILREPQENVPDELNGSILDVISCAGIIICSLCALNVKQTCPPYLSVLLDYINEQIHHIKDQTSRSSMIRSLPSDHCFTGKRVGDSSSTVMASKGNITKIHQVVVGFEDEVEKVIDQLTNGSKQLGIVPIVGMAGVGKTTLAKKVYDDTKIEHHFHIRHWCTVSQSYDKKNLLIQLLGDDGKYNETLQTEDEDDLLDMLYKKLKRGRYLIVFDDIWDIRTWNDLKIAFPNDSEGSRVLFTSRFSNVAAQIEPHNLRLRTDEESWQLLQKKVFGEEDCPQSLLGPGREIASFCKGLPLTIVVIAGVLATIEHEKWTDFAKSLTSTMVSYTDPCKQSLELSYEHLPYHLKACVLYLGAFREGQRIRSKNLMWLWIAEGFVEKVDGKNPEDIAEEYMKDLISRNLVMVSERRSINGGVKACRVHDLLLEFCKAKAKEENFLQALQGYNELSTFNEPPNLLRLSICSSEEDFKKSGLFCPHLKSLLFFHPGALDQFLMFDIYLFPLVDISFLFCIYKYLIVLNLEHILLMQKEFPSEVESLLDLRYLSLRTHSMQFIPQSIAKLSNLETFCLKNYVGHVILPDTIWNMKKLRHLCVRSWADTRLLPNDNNLENSSTLQTLSTLKLPFDQEGDNIMRKIPNIRQLKIILSDGEIEGEREAARGSCNMSPLESLESLNVMGSFTLPTSYDIGISFPSTLKKLSLRFLKMPWSKISLIEKLPNLEVLKIYDSFCGEKWEMIEGGFPRLRMLTLTLVDVVEWTETDADRDDYFPCLQQLNLYGNLKLKKIPSCLERLTTLEMIKVRFSGHSDDNNFSVDNYSVVSLVQGIEEEQKSYGYENLKILIDCNYVCQPSL